jgi:hypothetical protein
MCEHLVSRAENRRLLARARTQGRMCGASRNRLAMTNIEPTSSKRISVGWLVCIGMALGALLAPIAVYITIAIYNSLYGNCTLDAEDRFGCALQQFVITSLSIIPGGAVGFIIAYWIGRRRYARAP